ncbi:hypothetical protein [Yoonia sp. 208BN28-4]|uniref:hypothetical protein n=1 Tax=Yoonia sp. 208BN28-4 TaxID=3126505 RepID=UPI003096AF50
MIRAAQADYLLIPLLDGQLGVAQVIDIVGDTPFCALTNRRVASPGPQSPLQKRDIIAFTRIEPSAIAAGLWPLAGYDQLPLDLPQADADTPVHDPAVIEAFMSAWHGLYPWDGFGDLFDQIKRPDIDGPDLDRPAPAT